MVAEIYWIEPLDAGRLAIVARPCGGDALAGEIASLRAAGIDLLVSLLTPDETAELDLDDERATAQAAGMVFLSLPIVDFGLPEDASEARRTLCDVHRTLAQGKSVGVHCRGSIGRSSLVAASLLTLAGRSAGEAWRDVERARGVPVPETDAQRDWVLTFACAGPCADAGR